MTTSSALILTELQQMPICKALESDEPSSLSRMAALGEIERMDEGTTLFRSGEPADALRFVVRGRVALHFDLAGDASRTIVSVSRGDLLGWSALRPGNPTWTLTARVTKSGECLRFDGRALRELCDDDPRFGHSLMKYVFGVVCERLTDTRVQVLDIFRSEGNA